MRSLLTYYDKKLHLKTVWNEGYEAGQKEIDELNKTNDELESALQDKIAEIAKKTPRLQKWMLRLKNLIGSQQKLKNNWCRI